MRHPHLAVASVALAAAAASLPAQASSGHIDSFGASALSVIAGSTVDFFVQYSVTTNASTGGGSEPFEPAPQEGYQVWNVNWSSYESETLQSVTVQGGGQSHTEFPGVGPGGSHGGSWSFSLQFATPGQYDIGASLSWDVLVNSGYSHEVASRNCMYNDYQDPTSLACDSWSWQYPQSDDYFSAGGSAGSASLRIEVLAAVPEPQTLVLWLAGLGLLGARWRATRR